jgi:hypothetical protein
MTRKLPADVERVLDAICQMYAAMNCYPGASAADFKRWVLDGRLIVDMHPDGKQVRLVPSALNPARGSA